MRTQSIQEVLQSSPDHLKLFSPASMGILREQNGEITAMFQLLALSQSCIDAEEAGFDILESGCRAAGGVDVAGGFIFFGLLVAGAIVAVRTGQL